MSVFGVILVHIFPAVFRIRTEYGETRTRENAEKIRTRMAPNTDTFYAVDVIWFVLKLFMKIQRKHKTDIISYQAFMKIQTKYVANYTFWLFEDLILHKLLANSSQKLKVSLESCLRSSKKYFVLRMITL